MLDLHIVTYYNGSILAVQVMESYIENVKLGQQGDETAIRQLGLSQLQQPTPVVRGNETDLETVVRHFQVFARIA